MFTHLILVVARPPCLPYRSRNYGMVYGVVAHHFSLGNTPLPEALRRIAIQGWGLLWTVSRKNFWLCGLPPKDMWEDVTAAWIRAGYNVHDCWRRACAVTNEWVYEEGSGPLKARIRQRINNERSIPLKNRTLAEVLSPQASVF